MGFAALIDVLQVTLDGLVDGGVYALVGLGLSLSFLTLKRLNLAFGATAMLGAYLGAWAFARGIQSPAIIAMLVLLGTLLAAWYVELLCFRGRAQSSLEADRPGSGNALQNHEVVAMAASFAIWMQLEQLAVNLLPAHLNAMPNLGSGQEWQWMAWSVRPDRLGLALLGVALCLITTQWLSRSRAGLAWRATANHGFAAFMIGLPVAAIQRAGFLTAAALSAIAALGLVMLDGQITPMFGMWLLLKGLVVTMLLGTMNISSVLWGGLLLGQVEVHAQWWFGAQAREFSTYALLLAMLIWRSHKPGSGGLA